MDSVFSNMSDFEYYNVDKIASFVHGNILSPVVRRSVHQVAQNGRRQPRIENPHLRQIGKCQRIEDACDGHAIQPVDGPRTIFRTAAPDVVRPRQFNGSRNRMGQQLRAGAQIEWNAGHQGGDKLSVVRDIRIVTHQTAIEALRRLQQDNIQLETHWI